MVIVGVVGLVTSQSDRLFGQGSNAGQFQSDLENLKTEIHRVDTFGCIPSVHVRRDVAEIKTLVDRNKTDVTKLESKLDKIIELLTDIKSQ